MSLEFTSKSRVVRDEGKYVFTFFCDMCDRGCTTQVTGADSQKTAMKRAREEARQYFNLCHRCRKWVCDTHYNEDVMLCVECAPKK